MLPFMLKIYTSLILLLTITMGYGQIELHHRVTVDLTTTPLSSLVDCGVEVDHGILRPGKSYSNDMPLSVIECLQEAGVDYEIVIRDMANYYAVRANTEDQTDLGHTATLHAMDQLCLTDLPAYTRYRTPSNYDFGDMGGYLTYEEAIDNLSRMSELYPDLVTPLLPIGDIQTHEGLPVYYLRISDNAATDELDEPEVLYTSLHHAREPNSLAQNLYYMWYLLENYERDPEIRAIVDHTELYFVPIINPDGYLYNEAISPMGGGLWRKNRAVINGNTQGVDLNRNYGFQWGIDEQGSSPDPESQTYRGPAPFSEPETRAIRQLCQERNFRIALNYHTFGNILIFPWAYSDEATPDDAVFQGLGEAFTADNRYVYGVGSSVLGYTVNGDSDDYMYALEEGKLPIIAMTPEVGAWMDGFWPSPDRIDLLNKQSMLQNSRVAQSTHNLTVASVETMPFYASDTPLMIPISVKRYGFSSAPVTITVAPTDPTVTAGLTTMVTLEQMEDRELQLEVPPLPTGTYGFVVAVDMAHYTQLDTFNLRVIDPSNLGIEQVIASTDFLDWSTESDWSITTADFVSAPQSLTDSPDADYESLRSYEVDLLTDINLADYVDPVLRFMVKYDIEEDYDYGQLQFSNDGGLTWQALCGTYTEEGVANQIADLPVYDGMSDWVMEEVDLSSIVSDVLIDIRMVLVTDASVEEDGMYIDDLVLTGRSTLPSAVGELWADSDVKIFPNPTEDVLYIQNSKEVTNCYIYDAWGQQVDVPWTERSINLQQLPAGLYHIQLQLGTTARYSQTVVKR